MSRFNTTIAALVMLLTGTSVAGTSHCDFVVWRQ